MPESRAVKILSCASCRHRKIKCDKAQPACTQCARFGLGCVYPSRKPTRRTPRPKQSELLDRISRLETIVGQADPEKLRQLDEATGVISGKGGALPSASAGGTGTPSISRRVSPGSQTSERQEMMQGATRYISREFWGNLCEEVEGIRQILEQPSDDEDEDEGDTPESSDLTAPAPETFLGFMFCNASYGKCASLTHPQRDMMAHLWGIYTRNVDPIAKLIHRPTISKYLHHIANDTTAYSTAPHINALIFAIYFAAATCVTPESCLKQLGERQDVLAERYRLCTERALAEADYINSDELETLQAFTLYTCMMGCHSKDRVSWVFTSLVVRLAQARDLHRDGDGHQFSPYIAEMRRRLWNFIIVLDIRGSEDRGSEPLLARCFHNTGEPTAIDDEAFGPDSVGPLQPKTSGPAENVIAMCTAMCSTLLGCFSHPKTESDDSTQHILYSEEDLISQVRRLERTFIHTAVPSHLPSLYASGVSRIVILKIWLSIQYPFSTTPPVQRPRVSRETMLQTALTIIEMAERLSAKEWEDRFHWWSDSYVQWHPLAVALAELSVQTEGELVDKVWKTVDRILPTTKERIADAANGNLWRPIKKLLKKAREARAKAQIKSEGNREIIGLVETPAQLPPTQDDLQEQLSKAMTLNESVSSVTMHTYDSMTMDPSYLFEYPVELQRTNDFPQMDLGNTNMAVNWNTWSEVFSNTHETSSREGSGGGSTYSGFT